MSVKKPTPAQHALGITLSITVAVIWVASSELIQFILGDSNFNRPYFLTYMSTSLFGVLLLGFCRPSWRAKLHIPSARPVHAGEYSQVVSPSVTDVEMTTFPHPEDGEESAPQGPQRVRFSVHDVAYTALCIAPLYFMANLAFNVGLSLTSVASSSTISTLSTLFTLIICSFTGVEKFSVSKLVASLITIAGTAIISRVDGHKGNGSLIGDCLSVVAALIFGLYTTVLKHLVGDENRMDMGMMFAFVGAFACVTGWPGLPILNFLRWESFEMPSWRVFGLLLLNAAIGSVLSDYLWAKSVVLTTPLIGTVGLSLTVPIALVVDYFTGKLHVTVPYLFGVGLVVSGFVVVNVELAMQKNA